MSSIQITRETRTNQRSDKVELARALRRAQRGGRPYLNACTTVAVDEDAAAKLRVVADEIAVVGAALALLPHLGYAELDDLLY